MKKIIMFICSVFVFFLGFLFYTQHVNAAVTTASVINVKTKETKVSVGDKLYLDLKLNTNMYTFSNATQMVVYFGFEGEKNDAFMANVFDVTSDNPYIRVNHMFSQGKKYYITKFSFKDNNNGLRWYVSDESMKSLNDKPAILMESLKDTVVSVQLRNYITEFDLTSSKEVYLGKGNMTFNFKSYKVPKNVSVVFQNKNISTSKMTVPLVVNGDGTATIDLTKYREMEVFPGDYYISTLYLEPDDADDYVKYYACVGMCAESDDTASRMPKTIEFSILPSGDYYYPKTEEEANAVLLGIDVVNATAKINEKVDLYLNTRVGLISATLIFTSENESMTVNVKDLDTKPYFIVPFTTSGGKYQLDYAILKDVNGKEYQFRKGESYYNVMHYDFKTSLVVSEDFVEGSVLSLDNDKINDAVINKIKELDSNLVFEINANNHSIVSSDLFETIKGVNKTLVFRYKDLEWTFNGLDVVNPKQIDVSTSLYNSKEDDNLLNGEEYQGIVLDFADNEKLPGKCLIKIYNSDLLSKILDQKNANIYYYDEKNDKYQVIKLGAEYAADGYYDFYISHNSKYLITADKIPEEEIMPTVDADIINGTKEEESTDIFKIISVVAISIIIVMGVVIMILINKKGSKSVEIKK